MEPYHTLELTREDGSAWITLNRPDRLNALTGEMYLELERCAEELACDPSVGAIVITGRGRAFSAGADLQSYSEEVDMTDPHYSSGRRTRSRWPCRRGRRARRSLRSRRTRRRRQAPPTNLLTRADYSGSGMPTMWMPACVL